MSERQLSAGASVQAERSGRVGLTEERRALGDAVAFAVEALAAEFLLHCQDTRAPFSASSSPAKAQEPSRSAPGPETARPQARICPVAAAAAHRPLGARVGDAQQGFPFWKSRRPCYVCSRGTDTCSWLWGRRVGDGLRVDGGGGHQSR